MYPAALWVNLITTLRTDMEVSTPTLNVPFMAPAFKFIGVNVNIVLNEVSN